MFRIVITEKGGASTVREFDQAEVTIGRVQGNDIVLPKSNISKKHAAIIQANGGFAVADNNSTNGTYINGRRIDGQNDLAAADKVFIGDFTLQVEAAEAQPKAKPPAPPKSRPAAKPAKPADKPTKKPATASEILGADEWGGEAGGVESDWGEDWSDDNEPAAAEPVHELSKPKKKPAAAAQQPTASKAKPKPKAKAAPKKPPQSDEQAAALRLVHERLLRALDLRRMDVERMGDEELRERTREAVEEIVTAMQTDGELPASADGDALVQDVLDEALGLGPLEEFLADESITEVMVNHSKQIFIERAGKLTLTDRVFSSDQAVLGVIERIVAPIGRRIDESSPMVDARLKDGSRVNAIIPPLSLKGPTLTIRKFKKEPMRVDELVAMTTLTAEMANFLEICVKAHKSILISGGTGSGKTTTLGVLSAYIPEDERIITIEDAAELKLDQAHVVSLESRPPNIEGRGQVAIRDLVRNTLRMRPDRIVVGECRGGEALDMLQAMNTGHDGSLTTVHANTPRDALARLETMVLMAGMDLPVRAIRDQIASAIHIVVQQSRFPDGTRKLTHISEITGMESDVISMQDIFVYERTGFDENGKVIGRHKPTGFVPRFFEDLKAMGIPADMSLFADH